MNGERIRTAVAGAQGKMGQIVSQMLRSADGIEYVGGLVRARGTQPVTDAYDDIARLLSDARPQVAVDFTHMPDSKSIALACIRAGVRPVIGTSGYGPDDLAELREACAASRVGAIFAPNFAIGAILMMKFSSEAARYFSAVEIIELHETGKKDAPSGTALATARRIAGQRMLERSETPLVKAPGARGASVDGIGIHSLRLPGVVAHQQVVLGGDGETLTITHDSISRSSFLPGVLLAVRAAARLDRFVDGLESLL